MTYRISISRVGFRTRRGTGDRMLGQPIEPLAGKALGFVARSEFIRRVTDLGSTFDFDLPVYDPSLGESGLADEEVERSGYSCTA